MSYCSFGTYVHNSYRRLVFLQFGAFEVDAMIQPLVGKPDGLGSISMLIVSTF